MQSTPRYFTLFCNCTNAAFCRLRTSAELRVRILLIAAILLTRVRIRLLWLLRLL